MRTNIDNITNLNSLNSINITTSTSDKQLSIEKLLISKYGIILDDVPTSELDINETISELSYLTHSFFRYYGKFPSKLASYFLNKYANENSILLDNYVGSGTSLVEAKLLGITSYGIDINPAAILASNVKTTNYDTVELRKEWNVIHSILIELKNGKTVEYKNYIPEWNALDKWFTEEVIQQLSSLKKIIIEHKYLNSKLKDFFLLGFFSIIRRVSKAYDGEVRPHINKEKRTRNVYDAYIKKINEMIELSKTFNESCKIPASSKSILTSNLHLNKNAEIKNAKINLVLSHPPYLNCFDYLPVYSLELNWAIDVKELWNGFTLKDLKSLESKSWPATNESILYNYFDSNKEAYRQVYETMESGGICGIVIGDATIHKELIRVHKIFASICEKIGFELIEIVYRSTHYGTGKYAYKHRADYHGDEGKKDGIIILKKP